MSRKQISNRVAAICVVCTIVYYFFGFRRSSLYYMQHHGEQDVDDYFDDLINLEQHHAREKTKALAMAAQQAPQVFSDMMTFATQKAAVVKDRPTLILTYASYNYRAAVLNWIFSLYRLNIDNYGVVCLDQEMADYLLERNCSCLLISNVDSSLNYNVTLNPNFHTTKKMQQRTKNKNQLSVENITKVWILRIQHLQEITNNGIDVIFSDSDAVFLKNPFESKEFKLGASDFAAGRGKYPKDVYSKWGATACMGFTYFKSGLATNSFLEYAMKEVLKTNDDQVGINNALYHWANRESGKRLFGKMLSSSASQPSSTFTVVPSNLSGAQEFTVTLLSPYLVPRFCNVITTDEWDDKVVVAHCHSTDGVAGKTFKHWGEATGRVQALIKYKLWCLIGSFESEVELSDHTSFKSYLDAIGANMRCRQNTVYRDNLLRAI